MVGYFASSTYLYVFVLHIANLKSFVSHGCDSVATGGVQFSRLYTCIHIKQIKGGTLFGGMWNGPVTRLLVHKCVDIVTNSPYYLLSIQQPHL